MVGWEVGLLVAGWLAFGAAATVVMRRRGHDAFTWAVLFLFLGPLAFVAVPRGRVAAPPAGDDRPGTLDLLVADDGSAEAREALDVALGLLDRATSVTVVTVLDVEAESTLRGAEAERAARAHLEETCVHAGTLTAAPVDTALLFGSPAAALESFAAAHGYELIVAGSRGRGGSRALVGSVAGQLAAHSHVPVLVGGQADR